MKGNHWWSWLRINKNSSWGEFDKCQKMDNIYLWKIAFIELKKHLFMRLYTFYQENDTSKDVWLIIIRIDQRKEKAKQKACHVSLREFWFA